VFRFTVLIAILSFVTITSCSDTGAEPRVAESSTTTSTRPARKSSPTLQAQYTCGPADGPYITVRVSTRETMTVMSELIVGGVPLGQSSRVRAVPGIDTSVDITPTLTRDAWATGVGTVRLKLVDERGAVSRVLTSERIALRMPPGFGCG
jgi:hypothetical protein